MKKTIYIHKGQYCKFDDLTCERIVVNGVLKVAGTLTAKRIEGSGSIWADEIRCISLVSDFVHANRIIANEVMARQISADEVRAAYSLSVSTFIEAKFVNTLKAIVADTEIEEMQAEEICKLSPKARSLWTMLLVSQLRTWWVNLITSSKKVLDDAVEKTSPVKTEEADEAANADIQAGVSPNDPDFQEFARMYRAFKNGDIFFPEAGTERPEPERPHQFKVVTNGIDVPDTAA